jgi:hypothetical protein
MLTRSLRQLKELLDDEQMEQVRDSAGVLSLKQLQSLR